MDTKWLENVPGLKDFIVSVVRDEMRNSGDGTLPRDIPTEEPARACNVSADFKPKTTLIGNQVWMQGNLAIDDGGSDDLFEKCTGYLHGMPRGDYADRRAYLQICRNSFLKGEIEYGRK